MAAPARKPLISGNWKMHQNHFEAIQFVQKLSYMLTKDDYDAVDVSAHPPFTDLRSVQTVLEVDDIGVQLGAQHCHWEEKGAYTGQISAPMVKPFAVGAIVGHSEVRRDLGDDDARVAKKTVRALKHGLLVVLCVGEREDEFDAGATEDVLVAQMTPVLRALSEAHDIDTLSERLVVAYEPVWAIGTGKPATAAHATAATRTIRRVMREEVGLDGEAIPILYGGSVTAANAGEFAKADGIDGALVGGASLKAEEFASIVQAFG